jgi:hypothetical protein
MERFPYLLFSMLYRIKKLKDFLTYSCSMPYFIKMDRFPYLFLFHALLYKTWIDFLTYSCLFLFHALLCIKQIRQVL